MTKQLLSNDLTGTSALPFSLVATDGSTHCLADYTGRPLLLVFHRHLG